MRARLRALPVMGGLLPIQRSQVAPDVLAGITLAAVSIPVALGYAKIAGMPVVTGLYTLLLPMAAFAVLGSSRHLVVGADSATAAILGAALAGRSSPASSSTSANGASASPSAPSSARCASSSTATASAQPSAPAPTTTPPARHSRPTTPQRRDLSRRAVAAGPLHAATAASGRQRTGVLVMTLAVGVAVPLHGGKDP